MAKINFLSPSELCENRKKYSLLCEVIRAQNLKRPWWDKKGTNVDAFICLPQDPELEGRMVDACRHASSPLCRYGDFNVIIVLRF